MLTGAFDYPLPEELIAQHPTPERTGSRLLVLDRETHRLAHHSFPDLGHFLHPGDLLVLNDSRVIPARLRAKKTDTGGAIELLLLEENSPMDWWVLLRPGKRVRPGTRLAIVAPDGSATDLAAEVLEKNEEGRCRLRFSGTDRFHDAVERWGEIPLPPYMNRDNAESRLDDRERYQTVFARQKGSVAAPTAGLHFTKDFLQSLAGRGIDHCCVTLHVGYGTFAPVKAENIDEHTMHEERYELSESTCDTVNRARTEGRRIVAVGTTSVRVLETVGRANDGRLVPGRGRTRIFIHPPQTVSMVDALLTNFHLPRSTLLMLVSAFAAPGQHPQGRDLILNAYAAAIEQRYRFFSYGDAMLITGRPTVPTPALSI